MDGPSQVVDRIIGWMARPKSRRALMTLRVVKVLAVLIGLALIVAAFKVGTHQP